MNGEDDRFVLSYSLNNRIIGGHMELKIGDKYIIMSDRYNFVLQKKVKSEIKENKKPTGQFQDKMIDYGYFGRIDHALHKILMEDIKDLDEANVQMIIDCIRSTEKRITEAVKGIKRSGAEE